MLYESLQNSSYPTSYELLRQEPISCPISCSTNIKHSHIVHHAILPLNSSLYTYIYLSDDRTMYSMHAICCQKSKSAPLHALQQRTERLRPYQTVERLLAVVYTIFVVTTSNSGRYCMCGNTEIVSNIRS